MTSGKGIPLCKRERVGEYMTGLKLHESGIELFAVCFSEQGGEFKAVNVNPEDEAPDVFIWDIQKELLYIWSKIDFAPNIHVHVPIETINNI